MADFCNQCKEEMAFEPGSDYPDYGPLEPEHGWFVICEGCGFTLIDRAGNCLGDDIHTVEKVKHRTTPKLKR
jgi:hypothetical protein